MRDSRYVSGSARIAARIVAASPSDASPPGSSSGKPRGSGARRKRSVATLRAIVASHGPNAAGSRSVSRFRSARRNTSCRDRRTLVAARDEQIPRKLAMRSHRRRTPPESPASPRAPFDLARHRRSRGSGGEAPIRPPYGSGRDVSGRCGKTQIAANTRHALVRPACAPAATAFVLVACSPQCSGDEPATDAAAGGQRLGPRAIPSSTTKIRRSRARVGPFPAFAGYDGVALDGARSRGRAMCRARLH